MEQLAGEVDLLGRESLVVQVADLAAAGHQVLRESLEEGGSLKLLDPRLLPEH